MKANKHYKMSKELKMQLANWPKGHPMRTNVKLMGMEAELVNLTNRKKAVVTTPEGE